jgi:hypothetical protein
MRSLKPLTTLCGLGALVLILSGCGGSSGSSSTSASALGSASSAAAPASASQGSATLTWTAPTENSNGTALTDLAGYHIYYGTSAGALTNVISIASPSTLTYVVSDLSTGTWYFAVAGYTNTGLEGAMSNIGSKTIS